MNVRVKNRTQHYRTVTFDSPKNSVILIEQRLLPHEFKIIGTRDYRETAAAIKDMQRLGMRVVMLTGDARTTAESVGEELGIDEIVAGVLPAAKAEAGAHVPATAISAAPSAGTVEGTIRSGAWVT